MAKNNEQLNSAKYMHEQLNIPYKYLTKLMTDLKRTGFLSSVKGREGGFRICKSTKEITLAQIIDAVEGIDNFNACILGFNECSDINPCAMHFIWEGNKKNLLQTLNKTTLYDLNKVNAKKH